MTRSPNIFCLLTSALATRYAEQHASVHASERDAAARDAVLDTVLDTALDTALDACRAELDATECRGAEELAAFAERVNVVQGAASTSALSVLRLEERCVRAQRGSEALQRELDGATARDKRAAVELADTRAEIDAARCAVRDEVAACARVLGDEHAAKLRAVRRDFESLSSRADAAASTAANELVHAQSALAQALVERETAVADAVLCDCKMQQMMQLARAVNAEIAAGSESGSLAETELRRSVEAVHAEHSVTMAQVERDAARAEASATAALDALTLELDASRESSSTFRSEVSLFYLPLHFVRILLTI